MRRVFFISLIAGISVTVGAQNNLQSRSKQKEQHKPATEQTIMSAQPVAIFDSGYAALNIPFEIDQTNKAYIRGRVNGSENLRIPLDTGVATMFVIDRLHAERLNLKPIEGYQVQGSGSSRSVAALVIFDFPHNRILWEK